MIAILALSVRIVLVSVWAMSLAPKLAAPRSFAAIIATYEIVSPPIASIVAIAVMSVETALAVSWAVYPRGWLVIIATTLTLLGFSGATIINMRRGRNVPCGCFSPRTDRPTFGSAMLARNGLIAAFAFTAKPAASLPIWDLPRWLSLHIPQPAVAVFISAICATTATGLWLIFMVPAIIDSELEWRRIQPLMTGTPR